MSRSRFPHVSLALLILFLLGYVGIGHATESQVEWFDHTFGSSHVIVHQTRGEESTLLMDGQLRFSYPDGFQVHYFTATAPVTITSQSGFMQVQVGNDMQYGYDSFWLFEDVQAYLFALVEFSRVPMKYSGTDTIADRKAKRYLAVDDPGFVFWFDAETGLPLLIRQGEKTMVTVSSYLLENRQITSVELELLFGQERGHVVLEYGTEGWAPSLLELYDPLGPVRMELSDWSFPDEWEDNPLPKLATLSALNDSFLEEFEAKNYEAALGITQEMLALAPQFWQVYLYRAFAYEGVDNFLGVVENYQQVLMRQPENHLALNNLAYHYFLREVQIPQALEMAERAVRLDRKDIYLDTLGYGYYLVGRYEEAKELLLEALETAPDDAVEEITEHLNLVRQALGEEK
ncbi:MAG TPA: tetratricopeptide repeat protein [Firmicutes bacterium]|nr:tetratricopeptide repeat protein [Bacillota bacterium]